MSTASVRNMRILVRRDDATLWTENNPVLLKGEMGYEMDARGLKFGDGAQTWRELPYFMGGFDGIDGGGVILRQEDNPGINPSEPTKWPWGNYETVIS